MEPFHDIARKAQESNLLYDPRYEHDACGVGFVANIEGKRSYKVLTMAINSVCALSHRGAIDADMKTGDGAGVLTQIPCKIFRKEVEKLGHRLFKDSDLGIGFVFLPRNSYQAGRARTIIEDVIRRRGIFLFGWRTVPTNANALGDKASSTMPVIEQVLMGRDAKWNDDQYERTLFIARKEIERLISEAGIQDFYIPSFSHRQIVYKGLLNSPQLDQFYKDLRNPQFETALCVYHQRYSTNTFPTWPLAHPFRMLGHNGEINTIQGNRLWMKARTSDFQSEIFGKDVEWLDPVIQPGGSDSASVDNALELLVMAGRPILHAVMMLVPAAWRVEPRTPEEIKAFYEYHSCLMEPWDGPAALVFSDGVTVGACLDRNGLRPARYKITSDGFIVMGSENGTIPIPDGKVVEKGRLGPGQIIAVDTAAGKLFKSDEIKKNYATRKPYGEWVKNLVQLQETAGSHAPSSGPSEIDPVDLILQQLSFGYSSEEVSMILKPMFETGKEPVGSMGDDTPLAVLSHQPRLLYTYFKQLFAQVTNPPIDPLREELVMSLETLLGRHCNVLTETPEHARMIQLHTPILTDEELTMLERPAESFTAVRLSCLFTKAEAEDGLARALDRLEKEAMAAVDAGHYAVILSDRGVDRAQVPVPMLLATGAVHHALIRAGKRKHISIICETGEARDVHHMACLFGYGASAINPWLALQSIRNVIDNYENPAGKPTWEIGYKNFRKALEAGILKIISKMGISTLSSYRGAHIFEAIGVHPDLCQRCFTGTASRVGGIQLKEIAREALERHRLGYGLAEEAEKAFAEGPKPVPALKDAGYFRFRREGERHAYTPNVIMSFHKFVKSGSPEEYKKYVETVGESAPIALRHLLAFKKLNEPVPLEEVESAEDIVKRFTTAGMSLGALSPEAHECLAIAMNRIGAKSNSGEGGEDGTRFHVRPNGDSANSAIKQVASGRFGVTPEYLASAKELEIKMAQGSKPGEGGQLPGHKVSPLIARLRHSVPGVTLISPPPHHDIYSIEDLAQLIHDLKQSNPRARVCVKLVAEAGVGTIAAGVAKAYADIVLISGHDGGTGASPLSSVKNAGSPWEIGVAEAQQVLVLNDLRGRVVLRTDGGMRTGRDIVVAALLGAEEFNFGTAALVAAGCKYVRQCHLNTCPVGVATQDEKLRGKFTGSPEMVVNYFMSVAQEVREFLAQLGVRNLNEVIGRTEFLEQRHVPNHPKANTLDLSKLLAKAPNEKSPLHHVRERNDRIESPLDDVILQDAKDALADKRPVKLSYKIKNTHRCIGTKLSGEIAYRYGDHGLPPGTVDLHLTGSAGQSFGTFLCNGVRLHLTGEANDYVGKGMAGGEIIIVPPKSAQYDASKNAILGNTVLYGATGGTLHAAGMAGERFCVRNSGATVVVEGCGDHGCEYMTNGVVLILGATGNNFAAGMSGGEAFVLDEEGDFEKHLNMQMVKLEEPTTEDFVLVQSLIYQHIEKTESEKAKKILANWKAYQTRFRKVTPHPPEIKFEKGSAQAAANSDLISAPAVTKI